MEGADYLVGVIFEVDDQFFLEKNSLYRFIPRPCFKEGKKADCEWDLDGD